MTFAVGGTPTTVRTRTFTIPILSDTGVEGPQTVNLTLSGPTGGAGLVTGRDTAVLTINEDDVAGVIQFSALSFNAIECAITALTCNATLTVSRTGGLASGVTVDFATADVTAIAGTDYGTLGEYDATIRDADLRGVAGNADHQDPAADRSRRAADQVVLRHPEQPGQWRHARRADDGHRQHQRYAVDVPPAGWPLRRG